MSASRCIVVGGGAVGSAVACALARDGWAVEAVVPPPRPGSSASLAAGAMLGVLGEVTAMVPDAVEALELDLRIRAGARYPAWLAGLDGVVEAPLPGEGTFVVASPHRPGDLRALAAIEAAGRRHGLPAERVAAADVPGLAPSPGHAPEAVLYLAQERWIDAPGVCTAALAAAQAAGASLMGDEVLGLVEESGRIAGVRTARHGEMRADEVVVCAGAGTGALLATAPSAAVAAPVILPAKGVGLLLATSSGSDRPGPRPAALRTPNREFACGLHLVPRGAGEVYLGATNRVSRHREILGEATAGEAALLLRDATAEIDPAIAGWGVRATPFGFRPLSADRLPVAGRTAVPGLSVATGTYRNGVLLAPLLADVTAADLRSPAGTPDNVLSPRPAYRFGAAPPEPAALLRAGLSELAELVGPHGDPAWRARLGPTLVALGALALGDDEQAEGMRRHAERLLRELPLVEMVPELLVELTQALEPPFAPSP